MSSGVGAACGALGRYDADRVRRMAARLGEGMAEAHRDDRSILLCDRPTGRWSDGRSEGVRWSHDSALGAGIDSWREASKRGGLGLLIEGDTRAIHSSVSGVEPLYWAQMDDAVYFSSSIDPLVAATDGPLTVDWEAWASIFLLGFPIAPGAPFREVRRLEPHALLKCAEAGVATEVVEWPWPGHLQGGDGLAERIAEAVARSARSVRADPVVCPLSGGWDSRLLLSVLPRDRVALEAWTIEPGNGDRNEELIARAVAERLDVPHSTARGGAEDRWRTTRRCAELTDYQCSMHGWLVPLAERLNGRRPGTIVDGIGGDIWIKGLFLTEEIVAASRWEQARALLWDQLAAERQASRVFTRDALDALSSLARAQFARATEQYRDHPAAPSLAAFRTRTACGISHSPVSVLGAAGPVAMPLIAHGVIEAAVAAPQQQKLDGRLYRRVLELAGPSVAELPSTNDPGYRRADEGRRPFDGRAARAECANTLATSPLASWLGEGLVPAIAGPRAGGPARNAKVARILGDLAMFGAWVERYRRRLRPLDPGEIAA